MTQRDGQAVSATARYRFLSSHQIARVVGGSPQQVLRRLQLLFHHGYLDRPEQQHAQLAAFFDEGNRPLVYGLGREGARLLADLGDPIREHVDWTRKNKVATNLFLAHTLEVAEVMLAFELACRAEGAPRLIAHHELLPIMPEATRKLRDPFRLRVTVRRPREEPLTIAVVPDRLFSLAYANNTRSNFALEFDRGTMDIKAKRLAGKSSFRRKLIGYFHAWGQGKHTEVWGFQSFRVLTITPSDQRIAHMIDAQREVTADSAAGLFLYTTPERLAASGPFGDVWVSSKRDGERLLQQAA